MEYAAMSISGHVSDNKRKYIIFDLKRACKEVRLFPILPVDYALKDSLAVTILLLTLSGRMQSTSISTAGPRIMRRRSSGNRRFSDFDVGTGPIFFYNDLIDFGIRPLPLVRQLPNGAWLGHGL